MQDYQWAYLAFINVLWPCGSNTLHYVRLTTLKFTGSKTFSPKNKKNLGMACHTPPLKKVKKQGKMPLPSLGPIPLKNVEGKCQGNCNWALFFVWLYSYSMWKRKKWQFVIKCGTYCGAWLPCMHQRVKVYPGLGQSSKFIQCSTLV